MRTWKDDADGADESRRRGDSSMELLARRDAVRMALHEAVRKPESEGTAWLKQSPILDQLKRLDELATQLAREEDYGDAINMALVAGERDRARRLIDRSKKPYGPLWTEYQKALSALLDRKPYEAPKSLAVKGWLATFVPLLSFAAALSKGEDTKSAEAAVDEAFGKRNKDKRQLDPVGIDGDGHTPVNWHLRKRAIRAAAGQD